MFAHTVSVRKPPEAPASWFSSVFFHQDTIPFENVSYFKNVKLEVKSNLKLSQKSISSLLKTGGRRGRRRRVWAVGVARRQETSKRLHPDGPRPSSFVSIACDRRFRQMFVSSRPVVTRSMLSVLFFLLLGFFGTRDPVERFPHWVEEESESCFHFLSLAASSSSSSSVFFPQNEPRGEKQIISIKSAFFFFFFFFIV